MFLRLVRIWRKIGMGLTMLSVACTFIYILRPKSLIHNSIRRSNGDIKTWCFLAQLAPWMGLIWTNPRGMLSRWGTMSRTLYAWWWSQTLSPITHKVIPVTPLWNIFHHLMREEQNLVASWYHNLKVHALSKQILECNTKYWDMNTEEWNADMKISPFFHHACSNFDIP